MTRVPQVLVPSLREPDIHELLRAVAAGSQPDRDRAIVLLLLDTGLRPTPHHVVVWEGGWRARRDSNPRPADPKSAALIH